MAKNINFKVSVEYGLLLRIITYYST